MREKQTTVYLCAAREQDAAALTGSAAALLYLERELTAFGYRLAAGARSRQANAIWRCSWPPPSAE